MAMSIEELKKEPNLAAAYQEMIREAAESAEASWNAKSPEERERVHAKSAALLAKLLEEETPRPRDPVDGPPDPLHGGSGQ